jgi:DNA-binding NarL/FixJ family response regulator
MDGVDAAKEIHDKVGCRVIFISGSNEPPTIARINEDHPAAILIKPVAPDDLRAALNS